MHFISKLFVTFVFAFIIIFIGITLFYFGRVETSAYGQSCVVDISITNVSTIYPKTDQQLTIIYRQSIKSVLPIVNDNLSLSFTGNLARVKCLLRLNNTIVFIPLSDTYYFEAPNANANFYTTFTIDNYEFLPFLKMKPKIYRLSGWRISKQIHTIGSRYAEYGSTFTITEFLNLWIDEIDCKLLTEQPVTKTESFIKAVNDFLCN